MKRKIMAMFLAFTMIFGSVGTVFAEENSDEYYKQKIVDEISYYFNDQVRENKKGVLNEEAKEADVFISKNDEVLLKNFKDVNFTTTLVNRYPTFISITIGSQEKINLKDIFEKYPEEADKDNVLKTKELREVIISKICKELSLDPNESKIKELIGKGFAVKFEGLKKDNLRIPDKPIETYGTVEQEFKVKFFDEADRERYKVVFREIKDGEIQFSDELEERVAAKPKLAKAINSLIKNHVDNKISGYEKIKEEKRKENGVNVVYYDFKQPAAPSGKINVTFKLPREIMIGAAFPEPLEYTPDRYIEFHTGGKVSLTYIYDRGVSTEDIKVPTRIGSTYEFKQWNPELKGNLYKDTVYTAEMKGLEKHEPEGKRVKGKDRVETAIKISKDYFGSADTVIVVDASNFPDAMTASVLAKQYKAPILLTKSDKLDSKVKAEIERLGASDVIIVGGNSSVSEAVRRELAEIDTDGVERIHGKDRYETSAKVAKEVVDKTGKLEHAVVASGEVFADALTVGPYAAREGYPILLVREKSLPKSVSDAITALDIKQVSIAGGTSSVSKALEASLPTVYERLSGKNRYETAMDIAVNGIKKSDEIFVANGEQWMDALVIGPVGGMLNMPILLTGANSAPKSLKDYIAKAKVEKLTAVGGTNMISERVFKELTK